MQLSQATHGVRSINYHVGSVVDTAPRGSNPDPNRGTSSSCRMTAAPPEADGNLNSSKAIRRAKAA
jgi:hypothetical protein